MSWSSSVNQSHSVCGLVSALVGSSTKAVAHGVRFAVGAVLVTGWVILHPRDKRWTTEFWRGNPKENAYAGPPIILTTGRAEDMKHVRLADLMIRDPFIRPRELPLAGDSPLAMAVKRLFPATELETYEAVLIVSRASSPKNVIDATSDGQCAYCQNDVWISPSSKRHGLKALMVCMPCLEHADGRSVWTLRARGL